MIEDGKKVRFRYTVSVNGKLSTDNPEELEYIQGNRMILMPLEENLKEMNVGDKKDIQISAQSQEIPHDERRVKEIEKDVFKDQGELQIGNRVEVRNEQLQQTFLGTITEVKEEAYTVDFNHPLAGKDIEFHVELLNIENQ